MMKKKELTEMYYKTLIEFHPFCFKMHKERHKERRALIKSRWGKLVKKGYMSKEDAKGMPYILRERLQVLGKILGRDVTEDLENYRKHPDLFNV